MEGLHLLFLAFSALFILISDHDGFLYFRGRKQTLDLRKLQFLHKMIWIGLLGLILTGIIMTIPDWNDYLSDPAFQVKMGFVGVLIINGLFIGRLLHSATHTPFKDLHGIKKMLLLLSGSASAIGWVGSTLIGFAFL